MARKITFNGGKTYYDYSELTDYEKALVTKELQDQYRQQRTQELVWRLQDGLEQIQQARQRDLLNRLKQRW